MLDRVWLSVIVKDKDDNITYEHSGESNSYVQRMITNLQAQMTQGASAQATMYYTNAVAGDSNFGIQVGLGTAAVAIGDTALVTVIGNGTGSGQLTYGGVSFTNPTTAGSTRRFTVARAFDNGSGSAITVQEVGLRTMGTDGGVSGTSLIERTRRTFTIANGATATLTYTLGVTV